MFKFLKRFMFGNESTNDLLPIAPYKLEPATVVITDVAPVLEEVKVEEPTTDTVSKKRQYTKKPKSEKAPAKASTAKKPAAMKAKPAVKAKTKKTK